MISHLSLGISDLERSKRFYDAALAPLGIERVWQYDAALGYGPRGGNDKLALFLHSEAAGRLGTDPGFHLAFAAPDRDSVHAFYEAALNAGGRDNGAPGPRPNYGPTYYAAFVIDPDGHELEAVHQ